MAPRKSNNYLSVVDEKALVALRHYELDAYAAVVTALRAEGHINDKKITILNDLREIFGISVERHKAEVRRAANDQILSKVAKQVQGVSCDDDWQSEGSRIVGVLRYPHPISAYTRIADEVAESLLEVHNELTVQVAPSKEKQFEEVMITPPENPQHILNNKLFGDITKLSEVVENYKHQKRKEEDEESINKDFLDSYVFLPGGTVVKVEPQDVPTKTLPHAKISLQAKSVPFKKQTASSNSGSVTSAEMNQYQTVDNNELKFPCSEHDVIIKDASKRPLPVSFLTQQNSETISNKIPKRHQNYERPSSHQLDHIYSTGNSPRIQNISQSINSGWSTKDMKFDSEAKVDPEVKAKSKVQQSLITKNSRKLSRSFTAAAKQSSLSRTRSPIYGMQQSLSLSSHASVLQESKVSPPKHVNIYPKISSTVELSKNSQAVFQNSPEEVFHEYAQQQNDSSPQKVFRPSMQITSSQMENTSTSSRDFNSSFSHVMNTSPVKAGLASVRAVVSQIATKSDIPPSTKSISTREQHLKISHASALITSALPQPSGVDLPQTELVSKVSPISPPCATDTATTSVYGHVTGSIMSALSQISSANIIKVTPRPLTATKGSQIITQIAGTRLNKAFSSVGNPKPSIIVVRQAPRKAVVTTSAKVLELEGCARPLPRVKSVTSGSSSTIKPSTIIRPLNAKVSLRDGVGKMPSGSLEQTGLEGGMHKVISKGKMRQLVLKPATTNVFRHSSQETCVSTNSDSRLPLFSDCSPEQTIASHLHAGSSAKTRIAIQTSPNLAETPGTALGPGALNIEPRATGQPL